MDSVNLFIRAVGCMGIKMDTQNLKTFLLLSQLKNFTRVSEQMFVAQSTVTNRISELEREVGKRLFERDKRQVELTREGMVFLDYARRILELEESSLNKLNLVSKYKETLRIGTTNTIYESFLAKKLICCRKENPDTAVKVILGHSSELLQQLQDGLLDQVYSYIPLHRNGYTCERFQKEKLVLVTDYKNTGYMEGIRREELVCADYLMCNFMLEEVGAFIRELFPPYYQFSFEIDNATKLIPYLFGEKSVSFLPESLVCADVKQKKLRVIRLLDFDTPVINSYRVYA